MHETTPRGPQGTSDSVLGHSHVFGQDQRRSGERRTLVVVFLTAITMVAEISAGIAFGSMALLADGLHMASHMVALLISVIAYVMARRHADSPSFSFGTGKVNVLGGYTGAILLAIFALTMVWESLHRFFEPRAIAYNQAILVAVLGLIVNGVSALLLGNGHDHHHHHDESEPHHHDHHQHDHNLKAAYLHVLADALTSVLAIAALLTAKYAGANWMDPAMGIVGAILVARWSWGLIRTTGGVLLDRQAPANIVQQVRDSWSAEPQIRIHDLHIWSIGPGLFNLSAVVTAPEGRSVAEIKSRIPEHSGIVHSTIELHREEDFSKNAATG